VRILPYRRVTIETVLPTEEVVNRLTTELNPPPWLYGTEPRYQGWIARDEFEIRHRQTFWSHNTAVCVTSGRIVPGRVGTKLELLQTLNTYTRVFGSIWLAFAGAWFVGLAIAYLRSVLIGPAN